MKKELIFLGPPACGKGTQTSKLSEYLKFPHVDTGSLLREAVKNKTPEGIKAESFMSKGQLVPTELVSKIIKNRLLKQDCNNGFILDGYPRSMDQAKALDKILEEIDEGKVTPQVFYFDVSEEKLVERLVNRRSCPKCGAIYNIKTMKLKDNTVCEKCGAKLTQRDDDTEEVAVKRFETYFSQTAPLIDLYNKRGQLSKLDASLDINTIYKNLVGAIK